MNRFVYSIVAVVTGLLLYRYRYQVINSIFRIRLLQKGLVRFVMNIPFVRNAIVSQVFR
ncbi:hypothetical protein [Thermaerobacillus caldiproteolyticus]|uniref:hypothetical protein n=1 Tax=Thermaerobacillus caldiproteolyticus TaxID=247480 RepID=UPI0018F24C83|nr:hypothetical protein [Anoxybacillus caldiproteolyticus]